MAGPYLVPVDACMQTDIVLAPPTAKLSLAPAPQKCSSYSLQEVDLQQVELLLPIRGIYFTSQEQ